ncbi:hypothetical protein IFM12275_36900 [Nocardia sputorum]|uniref:hypothetical protein n=1 Tax=Nocardia sputorum TaxID=2984338 RepID=UPI00249150BA|nr:hypothetical protein [Nocardia sputorum]BDT93714.1 hypothetical protein IFM12275_36900 [Nocardia sputorum]
MDALIVTIFGSVVVLLAIVIPLSISAERSRKETLRQWAAAHGWAFAESGRAQWAARLPGHNSRGLGVTMSRQIGGRWVTVAEYSYRTTSSTGSSTTDTTTTTTTHHFVVVLVLLDRMYPPIEVLPRGLLSQLGRAMFGDKPTTTGNVLFDSQYRIVTADPSYAKALVGPPLIDAHIARMVPPWSLAGAELLTFVKTSSALRDPSAIPGYAAPLLHVAELLGR